MNEIGHNQPPDMVQTVGEVTQSLSDWLSECPVIQTEEQARAAKLQIDRGNLCVKDLEDERTSKVRPFNERVREINEHYRSPRELLERVVGELKNRINRFIAAEEAKRIAAAEEIRQRAKALEQDARAAEEQERDSIEAAHSGELGVDIALATSVADEAFKAYQKAERQAVIAERDSRVKIGGGFTRALSLKSRETLEVTDLLAAVTAMKDSGRIIEAVIKAARSYKKVYGKYPPGISATIERKV